MSKFNFDKYLERQLEDYFDETEGADIFDCPECGKEYQGKNLPDNLFCPDCDIECIEISITEARRRAREDQEPEYFLEDIW